MKAISGALLLFLAACGPGGDLATTSGGTHIGDRTWGDISVVAWSNGDKLNYAIAAAQLPFEPLNPALSYTRSYDVDKGASVVVNGKPIRATTPARLLTVNPFGELEEILLSDTEASAVLQKEPLEVWTNVVWPRVAAPQGQSKDGRRVGHWIVSHTSGGKGYEGAYVDGLRDGEWIYYRRGGGVRARLNYKQGKLDGEMVFYDEEGRETRRTRWKDDFPTERPETFVGLSTQVTRNPDRSSSGGTR